MKYNIIQSKILRVGILGAALLFGQSCSDSVLDEEIISGIGSDYLNTTAGFNDGVNATYSTLRDWYGTERGHNFTAFGTDIITNGADGSFKFVNTYGGEFDSQVSHVREVWDLIYRGINTANAVIERAPAITGIAEATKKQRVAEVKVLRAHFYFILTRLYGGVDLRLTETVAPTKIATRATIPQMYAAILKDLTEALPDLNNRGQAAEYGRVTKAVAEMMLADIHLTKATSEAKAADDYAKAATYANNVIKNYSFRLLPNFADVYRQGNEKNDEIVFATQFTGSPLTNGGGNNSHVFYLMEYDVQPGMQRDTENGRPFKRYRPTNYTLNKIFALSNRSTDSRYFKTFRDVYFSNRPGRYNTSFDKSKPSVTFALGDTAIFDPGFEMSLAERAKRPYQVLVPSEYNERFFPALRKHMDGARLDRTQFEGTRDYFNYRLGETYLTLSEALLNSGDKAGAVAAINMVRRRAAWPGREKAMEITEADMNMELIYEERARELYGEMQRWFDLKRWGILIERVKAHNSQGAPNITAKHLFRPIPQNQIDRVEGNEAAFPQNQGY